MDLVLERKKKPKQVGEPKCRGSRRVRTKATLKLQVCEVESLVNLSALTKKVLGGRKTALFQGNQI